MKISLKTYLIVLILLATIPLVVLNVSYIAQLAESEERHIENALSQTLEDGNRMLNYLLNSSLNLLSQIVQEKLPIESFVEPFKDRYASAGMVNENGDVIESFPYTPFQVNVSDREWFKQIRSLKGTIVGGYLVERVSNRPGLIVARAIDRSDGGFGGAVFVVINQMELQRSLSSLKLPSKAVATIRDANGLILARNIESEKWVGKELPDADIFRAISIEAENKLLRARGVDQIERMYVYSFIGIGDKSQGGIYFTIGVPVNEILKPLYKNLLKTAFIVILTIAFVVVCMFIFSRRFITEPVNELKRAAISFSKGLSVKISPSSSWPYELRDFAIVFNNMEEKILEHQHNLETLIDQIPGVLYRAIVDSPISYVFVSSKIKDFTDFDVTEVSVEKPFPWFDLILPEDRDRVVSALRHFVEGSETTFRAEYRVVDRFGVVRWIRDEGLKVNWRGVQTIQGIWRDVSWRVKSEQEIKLLKSAIEEASDGYAILKDSRNIIWTNMAFLRMVNCDEVFPRNDLVEIMEPIVKLDPYGIDFLEAVKEGREWKGQLRVFTEGMQKELIFDVSFSSISRETGKEDSVKLLFLKDVTEEVLLQRQLFVAQKMESLGTLVTGIAHDFNNILMIILGYTELAMMELSGENRVKTFLEEVFQAGQRAKNLVGNILSFARETPQERIPISLSTIVKENIKFLQQLVPAGVKLVSKIDISAGDNDTVLASPVEIQQLLMNLVVNAVQAMDNRGTISVCLSKCELEQHHANHLGLPYSPNGYLKLSVKDTGCGIDPSIIHRIFDPYFTTKPPGKGTGMGLTIVYRIVKNMNGIINVESKPGSGTVFRMFFPVCDLQTISKGYVGEKFSEIIETPLSHRRPLRLLVVDDEEAILRILKLELEQKGFLVTTFSDPERALKQFCETPFYFDAAIFDHQMPKISGLELARQVFNIRSGFPVIILAGFLDERVEKEAKALGVFAVLSKPASSGEIFAVLMSCEETAAPEESIQDRL